MPWKDAPQLEAQLKRALDAFNWQEAEAICGRVVGRIRADPDPLPEDSSKLLMYHLRRKRRFQLMTQLAEALLQSGLRTPLVRRQYAQALIDQGVLAAGEMVLQTIIHDPQGGPAEEMEARGLTGRIYKQLYVNNDDPVSPRNRANLERALNEYLYSYRQDPQKNLWHGINVVALADRARRDNFPVAGLPDAAALATDILAALVARGKQSNDPLPPWDEATKMEAYVALGRYADSPAAAAKHYEDAAGALLRYVEGVGVDAFEIYGTIRQLTEVWQLDYQEPPGSLLLPILKAGHLAKEGATAERDPKKVREEAQAVGDAVKDLEAIFGEDRMVTLKWYRKGLEQCDSVARVEKRSGKGHGTGWLVRAEDFVADRKGVLLMTNNHVVSDTPNPYAIFPEDSQVNFQALGEVLQVEDEVVASSPYTKLDYTLLALKGEPKAKPLALYSKAMQMVEPPPRLYVIGHPRGRDLELSLQDNNLLACNDTLLHYRTPTEPGSSGSPVFEPEDWRVVALHHKGGEEMPRLDGQGGTYQANEGITIPAIRQETRTP